MAPTADKPATLQQARVAKSKAESLLARNRFVNGVGIARVGNGWGVKVNLSGPTRAVIPEEIDGVPVRVEVVGRISKH